MLLSELPYAALLAYSPHGTDPAASESRDLCAALKRDLRRGDPPELISVRVARRVRESLPEFPGFFGPDVTLVPVPKSSLLQKDELWVPERLARALVGEGLGRDVAVLLRRKAALPKSAGSQAPARSLPRAHFDSLEVVAPLARPGKVLLVDDVVTRGATLLGAASRLAESFPGVEVRGFAAIRTVSNPLEFERVHHPVAGKITYRPSRGDTLRRP